MRLRWRWFSIRKKDEAELEEPRVGPRGSHPSRRRCRAAYRNPFVYPVLHFFRKPRHPAGPEPHPLGELAGSFKTRNMREAVRNSIDRFQLFLADQFLCHRTLPSKREHRDARQEPASPNFLLVESINTLNPLLFVRGELVVTGYDLG